MTTRELHARIRALCLKLLATVAMHPLAISAEVHAPIADVNEALHFDWHTFRQVAGPECFLWTVATNAIAQAAQREVVGLYRPAAYAPMSQDCDRVVGQLTATSAIGRALLTLGSGTIEELAASAGCGAATIQQQAARFSDQLVVTKQLVQGDRGRGRWRITRIALGNMSTEGRPLMRWNLGPPLGSRPKSGEGLRAPLTEHAPIAISPTTGTDA